MVSRCHQDRVFVAGHTSHYYVCEYCHRACDLVEPRDNLNNGDSVLLTSSLVKEKL